MSSGSILLQKLLQEQRRKHEKRRIVTTDASASATPQKSVKRQVENEDVSSASGMITKETTTTTTTTTIEVCLGPDCFGSGGGAALLELEDLVAKRSADARVVVGGCRNYCTMGPNVHIRGEQNTHYTRVNDPESCRRIVCSIEDMTKHDNLELQKALNSKISSNAEESLLTQREDGRRWRMLREKASKEKRLQVRERQIDDE